SHHRGCVGRLVLSSDGRWRHLLPHRPVTARCRAVPNPGHRRPRRGERNPGRPPGWRMYRLIDPEGEDQCLSSSESTIWTSCPVTWTASSSSTTAPSACPSTCP